jgi:Uncharacterised nucleotidyltransferase
MSGAGFLFGRWCPAPVDLAALEACLVADEEAAGQAFQRWADHGASITGNNRLHALLLTRAREKGWANPQLEELRPSARSTGAFSMLIRHHGVAALADLVEHGFEPVVLKGLALQELVYPNVSTRPITDVDVLFDERQANGVLVHLRTGGWNTSAKECFGPGKFASYAGSNYSRSSYEQLDVHWRISHWSRDPGLSTRMLGRSVPLTLDGVSVRTLDPTDHLLHTIAHGLAWEMGASVRWVADATYLIRTCPLDWDRFLDDVVRAGFGPPAKEALSFLQAHLDCEIPDGVIRMLADRRFSVRDRVVHWIRTGPPTGPRLAVRLLGTDYLARTANQNPLKRLALYPWFLWRTVANSQTHRSR